MREIALDTETTGLDPNRGDRMVEIGCVEMEDHIRTGKSYHVYLNPERDMPAEAERIHGLSADFLKDKSLFKNEATEFLDFLGDSKLIIHNATFDMKFINSELKRIGMAELPMSRTIDTVKIARKKFPGQPANLDSLCRRFNIDLSARTKHGALLDAELLADVYLELCGGRQSALTLDSSEKAAQKSDDEVVEIEANRTEIEARVWHASDDEKTLHREFLKQLKEPIWVKSGLIESDS